MTYKQIEASREARLWLGQIIMPAVTLAATIMVSNPEIRQAVTEKVKGITKTIKNKFKKEET